MKICVITSIFHPEIGGPSTYLYTLLGNLSEKGHKISVITFGSSKEKHNYPYRVTRISTGMPLLLRLVLMTFYILFIGRKYEILYVNDYGLPPVIANMILRKPIVMKIVGEFAWERAIRYGLIPQDENIDEFQKKKHSFKVKLLKRIQLFYANKASVIISPSEYFKGIISGWGISKEKTKVIYNAIDISRYNICTMEEARQKLGLSGKIILTVARLTPWKGVDKLIEILPHIKREIADVNLVIVGEGPELVNLQKLAQSKKIEKNVIFTDKISPNQIPYYLKAANVFALYSGYEGLPHVIIEAMASGVPIVASNKGGIPELIEDNINGILVPYGNLETLKQAIISLLNDETLSHRFVKESFKKLNNFQFDRLVKETTDVFEATRRKV
jgi:glycosyltransferase involved in cell wall biosynthesis